MDLKKIFIFLVRILGILTVCPFLYQVRYLFFIKKIPCPTSTYMFKPFFHSEYIEANFLKAYSEVFSRPILMDYILLLQNSQALYNNFVYQQRKMVMFTKVCGREYYGFGKSHQFSTSVFSVQIFMGFEKISYFQANINFYNLHHSVEGILALSFRL